MADQSIPDTSTPFFRAVTSPMSVGTLIDQVSDPSAKLVQGHKHWISRVSNIVDAGAETLAFCSEGDPDKAHIAAMASQASALITRPNIRGREDQALIWHPEPMRWFIQAISILITSELEGAVHPTAIVSPLATVGPGCIIGANAVVTADVTLGSDVRIGPQSVVGVAGLATLRSSEDKNLRMPHLGRVIIGNNTSIGTGCVVVKGILQDTVIEPNCDLGNGVNIGHNCRIASDCWISSGAVICGSASIGRAAMIGAKATINNHTVIGANAIVGLGAVVTKDVAPSGRVFGNPARPLRTMRAL